LFNLPIPLHYAFGIGVSTMRQNLVISLCGDKVFCPEYSKIGIGGFENILLNKGLMSEGLVIKTFFGKS
jgi:hypothetical protein